MTNDELAKYLNIENEPKRDVFLAGLSANKRALYDRMASLETEVELWQAGLASKPTGVLLDMEPDVRRRKAWR